MDRSLALELARVTEAAAVACGRWVGRGDKISADDAATTAMRQTLGMMDIDGTVVIGEGEMDEAPMLYIGEKVGNDSGPKVDIAVDPLEGTILCSKGGPGAIATIALAPAGGFLHAPDMYMEKIIVGPEAKGCIDINDLPSNNLKRMAEAKRCNIEDLTVVLLDRPRHDEAVADIRKVGARIKLISDGDVAPAVATGIPDSGIDMVLGIGGAPEGVLAAAAVKCFGGDMQARLIFTTDEERERAPKMGITDFDKVYTAEELASGDVFFAASGVTGGDLLKGVRYFSGGAQTQTIVMRSKSRTIRFIDSYHYLEHKPGFES
ncbi:class II fructose-bisphosphatase [Desulfuromonas acetoxidans]|uniref:Fructose-1,6-bisphosphatase n=1 Tax=Desulfuromonas acetoxidans (strain DSM 684 / 11070) TaxID=281689 RepID=Q1K192_DESA6|nr:class II fructose-bisphosphatase [Desulfuromonas acetoxidans]EAT16116.1 fructose-1,6-bisphosphatase, class II [Desulfuromonas acetoxidans DSM 684]MBF0646422.1 class II fructose-bisphosphatase [Desulfuromonas acetoxidans]NVD25531.1 class II fructose-bisphosphatase [Desulfuromonas acetoxidans]NVE17519.1 class II fructose-bisphosphatase [Desulfuromonas acetoxidans]